MASFKYECIEHGTVFTIGPKIIMKSDIVIYIHKFNNSVTQALRKENCEKTKDQKKISTQHRQKKRKKFF